MCSSDLCGLLNRGVGGLPFGNVFAHCSPPLRDIGATQDGNAKRRVFAHFIDSISRTNAGHAAHHPAGAGLHGAAAGRRFLLDNPRAIAQ